jgi:hypothetical protein
MSFIRTKKFNNKEYYYLVKNIRKDGKVVQKVEKYLGTTKPSNSVVPNLEG